MAACAPDMPVPPEIPGLLHFKVQFVFEVAKAQRAGLKAIVIGFGAVSIFATAKISPPSTLMQLSLEIVLTWCRYWTYFSIQFFLRQEL